MWWTRGRVARERVASSEERIRSKGQVENLDEVTKVVNM